MRKRRAIIFDDEPIILDVFRLFFEARGYEVMTFREPAACVVYDDLNECSCPYPCADIIITDYRMPKMNGIELLLAQARHGCRLTPLNKALMSGYIDASQWSSFDTLGSAFLSKPVDFNELAAWVETCESRMDLSIPLARKRREKRRACSLGILFGSTSADAPWRATAVNVSDSGVCLVTEHRLEPEQKVFILTDPSHPPQHADVRWIRHSGNGSYLVGMNFLP